MKAVILAGGLGTRLAEETTTRPKPMVEIGGMPILWHIMKIYSAHGIHDFIICCGYKGYMIKEFFAQYLLHVSDVTISMKDNEIIYHERRAEPWNVTLVDTGELSGTGGRLRAVEQFLSEETDFCFTYGDGVADVDIGATIDFHRKHGRAATMTAVSAPGRFGAVEIQEGIVTRFVEKPRGDGRLINGGFFVLSNRSLSAIENLGEHWEREPLTRLSDAGELAAYKHEGFWHPMDTLRDKQYLEELWASGKAPWKQW